MLSIIYGQCALLLRQGTACTVDKLQLNGKEFEQSRILIYRFSQADLQQTQLHHNNSANNTLIPTTILQRRLPDQVPLSKDTAWASGLADPIGFKSLRVIESAH